MPSTVAHDRMTHAQLYKRLDRLHHDLWDYFNGGSTTRRSAEAAAAEAWRIVLELKMRGQQSYLPI